VTSAVVIDVETVSKRFCRSLRRSLRYAVQDFASELITGRQTSLSLRPQEFWAVRDVSMQLQEGQALGLIGRNGAGKTTLLRMIAGLIRPDTGRVRTRGRVVPLLALGAGFNPVLSGRENIVVNMSILGVPKAEIRRRMDEVITFAEIDSAALDAPVRTYSSGMAARLGFACAVHTDPDVLLIDEVLAVGDISFRAKCYRHLTRLLQRGAAFVLVSHSPHSVLSICGHGVYLRDGAVVSVGAIDDVMRDYELVLALGEEGDAGATSNGRTPGGSATGLDILSVFLRGGDGQSISQVESGRACTLCVKCHSTEARKQVHLGAIVRDFPSAGEVSLSMSGFADGHTFNTPQGYFELQLHLPALGLRAGEYVAKLSVSEGWGMNILDIVESYRFRVVPGQPLSGSTFYQPREWRLVEDDCEKELRQ
jgi:lipopolysaccharide transport system ATP-binding protein